MGPGGPGLAAVFRGLRKRPVQRPQHGAGHDLHPATAACHTGASTSLARTMGFALGPALATLLWSVFNHEPEGMRAAMALATALSAASVTALIAHQRQQSRPGEELRGAPVENVQGLRANVGTNSVSERQDV